MSSSPRRYSPSSIYNDEMETFKRDLRNEMLEMVLSLRGDVAENFEIAQAALQQSEVCVSAMEQHQENINSFESAVRHDQGEVVEAVRRLARSARSSSPSRDETLITELSAQVESAKTLCISNTGAIQSDVVTLSAQVEHLQQQSTKIKAEVQTITQNHSSFITPGSGTIRQFRSFETRLEEMHRELTTVSNTVKKLQGSRSIEQNKRMPTKARSGSTDLSDLLERIRALEKKDEESKNNKSVISDESTTETTAPGPVFQASLEPNDKQWLFEKILELEEQISTIAKSSSPVPDWKTDSNLNNIIKEIPSHNERISDVENKVKLLQQNDEAQGEELQMLNCRLREAGGNNLDPVIVEVGSLREEVKQMQANTSPDLREVVRRCAALEARLDSVFNTVETLQVKSPGTNLRESDLYIQESPSPQLLTPSTNIDFTDVRQDIIDLKEKMQSCDASKADLRAQHASLTAEINNLGTRIEDVATSNQQMIDDKADTIQNQLNSEIQNRVHDLQTKLATDFEQALATLPSADNGLTTEQVKDLIAAQVNDRELEKVTTKTGMSLSGVIDDLFTRNDRLDSKLSNLESSVPEVEEKIHSMKTVIAEDMRNALDSVAGGGGNNNTQPIMDSVTKLSNDIAEIMGDVGDLAERMELVEDQLASSS